MGRASSMSVCCRNISPWVHPRSSRMQSQNISYNLRLLSISKVIISDISQNDKETRKFKIIKYFSLVNAMSTRKNIDRSFHWISNSRFHDETEPWLVRTRTTHITLDTLCVPCPRATDSVSVVYSGIPHRFNTSLCIRSRPSRLIYLVWLGNGFSRRSRDYDQADWDKKKKLPNNFVKQIPECS